jgi:hypothetical protein
LAGGKPRVASDYLAMFQRHEDVWRVVPIPNAQRVPRGKSKR